MLTIIKILLLSIMVAGNIIAYPRLPELLPTHWNFQGTVDGVLPKQIGIWLLPGMAFLMWLLFQFLPQLDPKKSNYKLFRAEWQIIQTALIAFIAYFHFVIFYISLNPGQPFLRFLFAGLGILFIVLGMYLPKIRQNYFIGIRVPWTLANEANWNKTHRFAGWCFALTGIAILVAAFLVLFAPVVIFTGVLLTVLAPIIYSFLLFKNKIG